MQNLILEASKYTPRINLDAQSGRIEIKGKSYPENTYDFYKPVLAWIEEYFTKEAQAITSIEMEIIYFNSSSSKVLYDLFDLLDELNTKHVIKIVWQYDEENESALEAGEDFKEDFDHLDFTIKKI